MTLEASLIAHLRGRGSDHLVTFAVFAAPGRGSHAPMVMAVKISEITQAEITLTTRGPIDAPLAGAPFLLWLPCAGGKHLCMECKLTQSEYARDQQPIIRATLERIVEDESARAAQQPGLCQGIQKMSEQLHCSLDECVEIERIRRSILE